MTAYLTDFADQAVILPLTAVVALLLLATGWRRGALVWLAGVVVALGVMLVLKLVFAACGWLALGGMLHSPSGHTASAAVVYGGLATLLVRRGGLDPRLAIALAVLFAVVFGLSRLELHVHTVLEVLIGGLVGVLAALAISGLAGAPPPGWRVWPVLAGSAVVLAVFHGLHLPAEMQIDRAAASGFWPLTLCCRTG